MASTQPAIWSNVISAAEWEALGHQDLNTFKTPAARCCPLPHFSALFVAGPDAQAFLQGQISQDVNSLTEDKLGFGGYCNLKGRLHGTFYIGKIAADTYILLAPSDSLSHVHQVLKQYSLFSKVTMTPSEADYLLFATYHAPRASTLPDEVHAWSVDDVCQLVLSPVTAAKLVWQQLSEECQACDSRYSDYYDICTQRPWIMPETIEQQLPHPIGLVALQGVDFKKGCYVGQEIIARMEYRSQQKKKRQVAFIECQAPVSPGTPISPQGTVINAVTLNASQSLLLIQTGLDCEIEALSLDHTPLQVF